MSEKISLHPDSRTRWRSEVSSAVNMGSGFAVSRNELSAWMYLKCREERCAGNKVSTAWKSYFHNGGKNCPREAILVGECRVRTHVATGGPNCRTRVDSP